MRRFGKVCARLVLSLLLLLFVVWGYAYARQWIFRERAERLFDDVKKLQVQKSNWSDMQRFMTKWGAWANYSGHCAEKSCFYVVNIDQAFPERWYRDGDGRYFIWRYSLDRSGIRPSGVSARVEIREGRVIGKGFLFGIISPTHDVETNIFEGPRLPLEDGNRNFHPNYSIVKLKPYFLSLQFTPAIDSNKERELTHLQWGCITSIYRCTSTEDLFPTAYGEYNREAQPFEEKDYSQPHVPLWLQARDSEVVFEGKIIQADLMPTEANEYWDVRIQPTKVLKGVLPHNSSGPIIAMLSRAKFPDLNNMRMGNENLIVAGELAESAWPPGSNALECGPVCIVVHATPESRAEVERGIQLDFAPYVPDEFN